MFMDEVDRNHSLRTLRVEVLDANTDIVKTNNTTINKKRVVAFTWVFTEIIFTGPSTQMAETMIEAMFPR